MPINVPAIEWYNDKGQLHRDDGPAVEYASGTKEWYKNGKLHRDDGPACEYAFGSKYWYKDGQLHRDDGPAIEFANGNKEWYKDGVKIDPPKHETTMPNNPILDKFGNKRWYNDKGQLHCDDGPAVEMVSGSKYWYKDGQLHRDDGPACEYANGDKEWWKNGIKIDHLKQKTGFSKESKGISAICCAIVSGICFFVGQFHGQNQERRRSQEQTAAKVEYEFERDNYREGDTRSLMRLLEAKEAVKKGATK